MIRAFGMFGRRLSQYYPKSSLRQVGMGMLISGKNKAKMSGAKKAKTRNATSQTWGH